MTSSRWCLAAVPLVAAVPGVAHASPPRPETAAESAVEAAAPNPRDFDLRRGADRGPAVRELGRRLHRSSVGGLLASSGKRRFGHGCAGPAAVPARSLVYCFDRHDTDTGDWVPQGVTSVSDAVAGERWTGGGRPMLVSWHNGGRIRLTVLDPDGRSYRHVLLVEPKLEGGKATYSDIGIHAGGIAWYGNRLYVADTRHGIREFDLRQIYDLARSRGGVAGHSERVGLHGGKYYAHGFRFLMPQTGSWRFARGRTGGQCRGAGPLRMSWVAVDRTASRHVLIAGEYCRPGAPRGRVVTWPLSALSRSSGTVRSDWSATLPGHRIQGGVRANGHWWFTQNRGERRGLLLDTRRRGSGWDRVQRRTISHGPEDLSCYRGQHRVWTVAEHPRKRALLGIRAAACG
ncbi:hypothetical protein [Actinomadura chibensis]|uniref:Secreted protein n=1 Tax=Actinomadura chibensis TaxID=392828 RepID=A0A5D0NPS6_9ACTN|nr:hypothetical protein [Actinomadura chibensis]TYB46603.1 hypothetical protein FXF69_15405 [Actinomadura chibensis]